MKKLFIFMTLFLFLFCGWASASTYYVTSSGTSGNGSGTEANPWQTFGSIGWDSLGPGDTLDGMGNTYNEIFRISASGSVSSQLVIQNMNFVGASYWVAISDSTGQDYITVQDITIDQSASTNTTNRGITTGTQDKDGWIIQRVTVHGCQTHGIWIEQANDLIIRNTISYDNGRSGVSGSDTT